MDIPDFEELEWLESHTLHDHDDFDDDFDLHVQPPSPPSSPEPPLNPPSRPILSLPPKPPPLETSHVAPKRLRSDRSPSTLISVDDDDLNIDGNGSSGKRSRIEVGEGLVVGCSGSEPAVMSEDDDLVELFGEGVGSVKRNGRVENDVDWTGDVQSPRDDNFEEVVEVQEDEAGTILSRFASEIDGDCVPITGLDGERVYAKLCGMGLDEEERRGKLNVRDFNGEVSVFT